MTRRLAVLATMATCAGCLRLPPPPPFNAAVARCGATAALSALLVSSPCFADNAPWEYSELLGVCCAHRNTSPAAPDSRVSALVLTGQVRGFFLAFDLSFFFGPARSPFCGVCHHKVCECPAGYGPKHVHLRLVPLSGRAASQAVDCLGGECKCDAGITSDDCAGLCDGAGGCTCVPGYAGADCTRVAPCSK